MRIVFLATLPPNRPTMIGRVFPLARVIRSHGHDVRIATLGDMKSDARSYDPHLSIVGPSLRGASTERPSVADTLKAVREGTKALHDAAARSSADVIILAKPHPQNVQAVRQRNEPIVLDADDDERHASRLTMPERWYMDRIDREAARAAQAIVTCSPALVEHYQKIGRTRVELIPTGIDEHSSSTDDLRQELGIPSTERILLYIGSLSLTSGHRVDHLLSVWETLASEDTSLHLVFMGDGIDAERIQADAARLPTANRIHFTGRFRADEADGYARQATLLVDPVDHSPETEAKSSSRTMLALRTGVPIITGNVGIRPMLLPQSVHEQSFYDPNHPETLIPRILYSLQDDHRARFQKETEGMWKQWTWSELGKKYMNLLMDVSFHL